MRSTGALHLTARFARVAGERQRVMHTDQREWIL